VLRLRTVSACDVDGLYAISLATGAAGGDAANLYSDGRMVGHLYSAPYAILGPETAFVAEDDDGVGGFIVGALDTRAFEERCEREWWPRLREIYADPSETPRPAWTADQRRSFTIHHPRQTADAIVEAFPAHIHMNLLPRMQGRGIGRKLLAFWLEAARRKSVTGVHCGVNAANSKAIAFWQAVGFVPFALPAEPMDSTRWFVRRLDG